MGSDFKKLFILVYVNHRPVFGLSPEKLNDAFKVLGQTDENGEYAIDRGHLLYLLQNKGETSDHF